MLKHFLFLKAWFFLHRLEHQRAVLMLTRSGGWTSLCCILNSCWKVFTSKQRSNTTKTSSNFPWGFWATANNTTEQIRWQDKKKKPEGRFSTCTPCPSWSHSKMYLFKRDYQPCREEDQVLWVKGHKAEKHLKNLQNERMRGSSGQVWTHPHWDLNHTESCSLKPTQTL